MEYSQPLDNDFGTGTTITPQIKSYLSETAKWAKFLAIVGFVSLGLMVLFALFAGTIMGSMLAASGADANAAGMVSGTFLTVMYLLIALIYFFPILYLYRFASKMQIGLRDNNQGDLELAFENLKSCYKFLGIFTAVVVGMYALVIIGSILFGLMASF